METQIILSGYGRRKLKNAEAWRDHAYIDANGKWTIAFGHKILPSEMGLYVTLGKRITPEEGEKILDKDLATKCGALRDALKDVHVRLAQNQIDALILFIYNIGVGAWIGSHARMKLREGDFIGLQHEMKRWVHDDHGNVIQGLVNRRQAEIDLFNTPYK